MDTLYTDRLRAVAHKKPLTPTQQRHLLQQLAPLVDDANRLVVINPDEPMRDLCAIVHGYASLVATHAAEIDPQWVVDAVQRMRARVPSLIAA